MKTLIAIAMVLALATSSAEAQYSQQQFVQSSSIVDVSKKSMTYKQAYAKAQAGDKPLLVMVTADWCPPCRQMKALSLIHI